MSARDAGAGRRQGESPLGGAGRLAVASLAAALLVLPVLLGACKIEPARMAELERASEAAQDSALEVQIRAALAESAAAWNRGDLDAFLSLYRDSPGTTFVAEGGIRRGLDEIRTHYAPRFRPGADRDSLRFDDLEARRLADDVAVVTARWILHRDGEVTGSGPFTLLLEKVEGIWWIVHDHSSSDPAAEALEAGPDEADGTVRGAGDPDDA